MEKIEFIPAARHSLLKLAAAVLAAVVVLSAGIGLWAGSAAPVPSVTDELGTSHSQSAPGNNALTVQDPLPTGQGNTTELEAHIAKLEAHIAELEALIAEQDTTIAAQADRSESLAAENTALTEQIASLTGQADSLQQQLDAYREQYGTTYFVVFQIRRKGLINESLSATVPVSREDYSRFQIGAEVTNPEPYLSIPGDWLCANWSITVLNKYQTQAETL